MKKSIMMLMLFLILIGLLGCRETEETDEAHNYAHSFSLDNYMFTLIRVNFRTESRQKALSIQQEIDNIYKMYHELTTNYDPLATNSPYKQNIYSINQQKNVKLEIDKELYDILLLSEELRVITNGYFNVGIGKIVDAWKALITPEELPNIGDVVYLVEFDDYKQVTDIDKGRIFVQEYTQSFSLFDIKMDITNLALNETISNVNQMSINDFSIELTVEGGSYYVKITGEDIKLDLGAISKGYATQKAYEYLKSEGVKYYSISAGSSSIVVGEHFQREGGRFWIELANPIQTTTTKPGYGTFYAKNLSVTTSGNYEQYVMNQGKRYHHIVSPTTKQPAHFYHTVTLIGEDAGLLDALSTALFSMNREQLEAWIDLYQSTYQIDIITYNQDRTISKYLLRDIDEDF